MVAKVLSWYGESGSVVTSTGDVLPAADFRDADGDWVEYESRNLEGWSFEAQLFVDKIEEAVAKATKGGYNRVRVEGKSIPKFLATELHKRPIPVEEKQRIIERYSSPRYLPTATVRALAKPVLASTVGRQPDPGKSWEDVDWAKRAAGDYGDDD